jgi:uncharacterized protein
MFKLLILLFFFIAVTSAQEEPQKEAPKYEMKQYFLVLLKRGPNVDMDSVKVQEVQKGHMAHINKMAEEKKLVAAGPFGDNTDLRGIFIFDVATMEEVVELTNSDPAVKSGRLIMEIHPWWAARGTCLP